MKQEDHNSYEDCTQLKKTIGECLSRLEYSRIDPVNHAKQLNIIKEGLGEALHMLNEIQSDILYRQRVLEESLKKKKVIIMRGVPGSGKSTKAKSFEGVIVSADDYFMNNGIYCYNSSLIREAHQRCLANFSFLLYKGIPLVIVDNTNIQKWNYEKYEKVAKQYGYEVEVVSLKDSGLSVQELAKRNIHGVPEEKIKQMLNSWED